MSVRALRSVSACALPRPSAIASAKFVNSTVNQSQSVTCSKKANGAPFSPVKSRTVVMTAPTSVGEHHRIPDHVTRIQFF